MLRRPDAPLLPEVRACARARLCGRRIRTRTRCSSTHAGGLSGFRFIALTTLRRCNRLHELHVFEGTNRTCTARLEQHNASRRLPPPAEPSELSGERPKRRRRAPGEVPPASVSAQRNCAGGSSPGPESPAETTGAIAPAVALTDDDLMVFDAAFGGEAFDLEGLLQLDADMRCEAVAPPPPPALSPALSPFAPQVATTPPLVAALAADVASTLHAHCVQLKLPAASASAEALPVALTHSLARLLTALGVPPAALTTCVRPGCILLTLDALLPRGVAPVDAQALLAALLADAGEAGAFTRAQPSVTVRVGELEATTSAPANNQLTTERVPAAARPPPLEPLAVHATEDGACVLSAAGGARLTGPLAARCGAAVLPVELRPDGSLAVRPGRREGAMLVEAVPEGTPLHRAGAARPVLLTTDAAIAAEVAAALPGVLSAEAAEAAVLLLGAALSAELPSLRVAAAAATLAAALGLPATLRSMTSALRARCATDRVTFEPHFLRLLFTCARARKPAARVALLTAHAECAAGAALAAALLRAAARDGHMLRCALVEAAVALAQRRLPQLPGRAPPDTIVLRSAAAVLAAMAESADAALDSDDEAEAADADAAMDTLGIPAAAAPLAGAVVDEVAYAQFVYEMNRRAWRAVALLALFVHTVHMWLYFNYMRPEPSSDKLLARGAVLRKQVHSLRFYDPADLSLPPMTALDYPWRFVLDSAPPYVAWTLGVHIPTHLFILACVTSGCLRPLVRRNYEPLFAVLSLLELSTYIYMDVLILRTTGRVPRYAFSDCAMHTIGVLLFHRTGPFRLALSNASVLYRMVVSFGICAYTRAWGMLLWPENAVQLVGLTALMVMAPGHDRRMRACYAEHVAKAAADAAEGLAAGGKRKTA